MLVAVADAAGILQDISAVLALICDVVDGEDGLDPVELIQMAVVQVQVDGDQSGLPVVSVDDVGGEVDVEQGLQDRKSTRLNSSHKVQSRMPSSA